MLKATSLGIFPSLAIEANSGKLAEFEGGGSADGRGVAWVVGNEVSLAAVSEAIGERKGDKMLEELDVLA